MRFCRKWMTGCLILSMLLSNAIAASARFADAEKHWASGVIDEWAGNGVVSGRTDGTFDPEGAITRAEFVSMIGRVFRYADKSGRGFPDVPAKAWYADDMSKAAAAGILFGDDQGKVQPDSSITRQEAAVFLYRAFRMEVRDRGAADRFKDASRIAGWGRDAVSAMVENGYMAGRTGSIIAPDDRLTRAEAVKLLDNAAGELKFAPGTYSGTVETNLVVNTKDVVLKDMSIQGNLYLAEGIGDGTVTLENVNVHGQTFVRGGGEHSIRLLDSSLNGKLVVEKKDGKVRVYAEGTTEISGVVLHSGVILEGDFDEVSIEAPGISVQIAGGTVANLIVKEQGALVQVEQGAAVAHLKADSAVTVTGGGEVGTATINVDSVTIEQQPKTTVVAANVTTTVGGRKIEGGSGGTTVGATSGSGGGTAGSGGSGGGTEGSGNSGSSNSASANTGIRVKPGQEAVVTGIWPGAVQVAYSTNVGQILAALQAADSSAQTYDIYKEKGGVKLSAASTVLMTANVLKVTAANGAATAEYRITVNPVGDLFVLTPVATTAGSEASGGKAVNATNNAGMSGYYGIHDSHDNDANGATMWLTNDNPGADNWIQVDLGAVYPLGSMLVWNYNRPGAANSGIKNAQVLYSADGSTWTGLDGPGVTRQFAQASGAAAQTAETTVDFGGIAARYVKIVPNAAAGNGNWGAAGPTKFGLSQLRIYRYASHVTSSGQLVTVLDVAAGSVNAANTPAINTVNNYGMSGTSAKTDTHSQISEQMWLTAPNPGENNWIQFDLGGTYPLNEMHVWNYNAQDGAHGINNAQVQYSVDGRNWTTLGAYQFAQASGAAAQGATNLVGGGVVQFNAASARYVKIVPNTAAGDGNWGSEALFGLSQVRFYSAPGTVIEPERDWTALFTRTSGWTGSDGIYTIAYNGYDAPGEADTTKTLFLFSDTFVGHVDPVSKQRKVADFTNNTLGVLTGGDPDPAAMDFIWGTDENGQTSSGLFVPETPNASPDGWYWLQDGLHLNDNIYISAMNVAPDPLQPPGWRFKVVGVSMIKVPVDNGELDIAHQTQFDTSLLYHSEFQWGTKDDGNGNQVPNILSKDNTFGAGFMANTAEAGAPAPDGYIYIYGYQSVFGVRGLLVARVLPDDFEDQNEWEFYGSSGWTSDISQAQIISDSSIDVSPELSVTPIIGGPNDGKYRLVYSTGLFSADHGLIKESISDTPFGPFGPATTLYYTPEDKSSAAQTYIYNAKAHPNISKPGELLITYNVNSTQDGGNVHYNNGDLYHPRFINMRQIAAEPGFSSRTDIAVKPGHESRIGTDGASVVDAVYGTTADDLLVGIVSVDGSPQTYKVLESPDGLELTGASLLEGGQVVQVTAADGVTTADYDIHIVERFISGVTATAGSEESTFGMTASKAVNHSGMSGTSGKDDTHDNNYANMWKTPDDADNSNDWIQFDLGGTYRLGQMAVWNYNEDDGTGWLKNGSGIRYAAVEYSADGASWTTLGGMGASYQFAKASNGTAALEPTNLVGGGVVDFGGVNARYVRITPNGATDPNPGNYGGSFEGAFGIQSTFGLSEVRFYTAIPTP